MLKRYDQVILLCPVAATGGPEALHQLAQLINEEGIPAKLAYYGLGARIGIDNGVASCSPPTENICLTAYSKYNPIVASQFELTDRTLIILPEVRIAEIGLFRPAEIGIWWLSVANAFHETSPLRTESGRLNFFGNRAIHHFCQTFYSRELLRQNNVNRMYDLVDYTDDLFTLQPPSSYNPGVAIAYNPKKGTALADAFFASAPNLHGVRIERMSKRQILDTFRKTKIYIEFGHNPGKDRMPREAMAAGCIVLAHRIGGTAFYDDVPLDDQFKFSQDDVISGRLSELVNRIIDNPQIYWDQQSYYRKYVYTERDLMKFQVSRIFKHS